MQHRSEIVLPYEPGYTCHRDAMARERETRAWLRSREQMLKSMTASPPLAPSQTESPLAERGN